MARLLAVCFFVLSCSSFVEAQEPAVPDSDRISEIARWLPDEPSGRLPSLDDRDAWARIARYAQYRDSVKEAEALLKEPIPDTTDALYQEFSRDGNRSRYERVYFAKIRRMRTLVVAEGIENQGRFLPALEATCLAICEMRSWLLPAHDGNLDNFHGKVVTIDLFASELGWDLAEIRSAFGGRLSEEMRARIDSELKRRIFDPYERMVRGGKPWMWWLTGTNNWNAVCLCNVTGAHLAAMDSRQGRAFAVAAAEKHIASFFRGFTADGYCSEGIGYWNYGYGFFVRLGHLVGTATDWKVDLFELPKARPAAVFSRRIEVTPGGYPSFADCSVDASPDVTLMAYVNRKMDLGWPEFERWITLSARPLGDFGIFDFLADEDALPKRLWPEQPPRDWFEEAGILICRTATEAEATRPAFGAALKGGHNAEHHNHNDIGSFVVFVGEETPLVDPGGEVYTRRTFGGRRYDSGVLNSFGHPVPRVAGQLQRTGGAAAANVLSTEFTDEADTIRFDLTSGYPVETLTRLHRTFRFQRTPSPQLTVTDEVEFTRPEEFETALVTFGPWSQIDADTLSFGDGEQAVTVQLSAGGTEFEVKSEEIHEDLARGRVPTRIAVAAKEPISKATFTTVIRPAE